MNISLGANVVIHMLMLWPKMCTPNVPDIVRVRGQGRRSLPPREVNRVDFSFGEHDSGPVNK